jgi:hypothetical protein
MAADNAVRRVLIIRLSDFYPLTVVTDEADASVPPRDLG